MRYTRFEQLPVWNAACDFAVAILTVCDDPAFVGVGDVRNQLQRAAVSVGNNIAEGFERGTTNELITFLYYAKGSCGEVRSMLLAVERLPRFFNLRSQISNLKSKSESISRQLAGWAESLQNAGIKGVRYLNDAQREKSERASKREQFEQYVREVADAARAKREGQGQSPASGPGVTSLSGSPSTGSSADDGVVQ
jgi:four helix bundle protein